MLVDDFLYRRAGKVQVLFELLEPIIGAGEKVLIFTQVRVFGANCMLGVSI